MIQDPASSQMSTKKQTYGCAKPALSPKTGALSLSWHITQTSAREFGWLIPATQSKLTAIADLLILSLCNNHANNSSENPPKGTAQELPSLTR